MDWTVLLSALGGVLSGGVATSWFTRKQTQGVGTADAIKRAGEAMDTLLVNIKAQQDTFNAIIDQKDTTINQLYLIINQKDKMIEANEEAIAQLKKDMAINDIKLREHARVIKGLQEKQNEAEGRKLFAEKFACSAVDCPYRNTKLGKPKHEGDDKGRKVQNDI